MGTQKAGDTIRTSRRRILGVGAAGLGALLVPGVIARRASAAAAPQETTIDRIKRTGVFNLGVRDADPPYGFLDNNKHVGFSTEIAERVHDRIEKELKSTVKLNYVAVTSRT